MARTVARAVHPRGARPDTFRTELDQRPKMFYADPPRHTPGAVCGACKPARCKVEGCDGHVHTLQLTYERVCDVCKVRS